MRQCWPRSMTPYGVTRPQGVNTFQVCVQITCLWIWFNVCHTLLTLFCQDTSVNMFWLYTCYFTFNYPGRWWNKLTRKSISNCILQSWNPWNKSPSKELCKLINLRINMIWYLPYITDYVYQIDRSSDIVSFSLLTLLECFVFQLITGKKKSSRQAHVPERTTL